VEKAFYQQKSFESSAFSETIIIIKRVLMKKGLFYALMLLVAPLTLITCNDDSDGGKVTITDEIIVKTKSFDTYIHLNFVDAKTGNSLRGTKVSVTVSGKDTEAVYNNVGISEETYVSESGMFDLVVDPAKTSSDFVIKVTSAGYNDYTYHARLYEGGLSVITASLVSLSAPPAGVSHAAPKVITASANGATGTVSIPVNSSNAVKIPQGAILKDAQGNVVTGEVASKVLFFDPAEAQAFFPGGLDVEAVRPDGETADISFSSAGLFDIELTSGSTQVRTIEGEGIELTTTLDPSLINPNTGKPVAENDEIEMWSMDPETNVWNYEKTAVVKRNAGGLYLQEKINHLSTWNWDWFTNSCYAGASIKWTGDAPAYTMVTVKNQTPINSYSSSMMVPIDVTEGSYYNTLQFNYVPANTPTILRFEGNGLVFEPATLAIPNLCDASKVYPVKVTKPGVVNYTINIHLDLYSKSDPTKKLQISGYAYLTPAFNYSAYQYATITNGTLQTNVEGGVEYELQLGVGSVWGWGYLSVTDAGNNRLNVTFAPELAYSATGYVDDLHKEVITVDKPSNGVIDINASFAINEKEFGF
jgi:hypothetical protein